MSVKGAPKGVPKPYPGQERHYDGEFNVVEEWTEELALTATRAMDIPTREGQVARIRDAVGDGVLPEAGVDALIEAGWTELED